MVREITDINLKESPKHQRFHGLDAMRASMMLLGLVFHSSVSYTHIPLSASWPFRDTYNNFIFDVLVYGLHLFRMPAFFVIAGFFAALVYYKRGMISMLKNRFMRVTLPLIFLWIFVVPGTYAGFVFANNINTGLALISTWDYLLSGAYFHSKDLAHLWFLYHLTIFYLVMVIIVNVTYRLPDMLRERFMLGFNYMIMHPSGICLMVLITLVTLFPMSHAGLETNTNLTPPLRGLIAYGVFFIYGWLLFNSTDLLDVFCNRTWPHFTTGIFFTGIYCFVLITNPVVNESWAHLLGIVVGSIGIWALIYGLLGFFCRYMDQPSQLARYFSDASYWMYLVHVPLIIFIAGALLPYSIHPVFKFLIVYILTNFICVTTYDLFVRSTFIGAFLNGKRNPRGLPK